MPVAAAIPVIGAVAGIAGTVMNIMGQTSSSAPTQSVSAVPSAYNVPSGGVGAGVGTSGVGTEPSYAGGAAVPSGFSGGGGGGIGFGLPQSRQADTVSGGQAVPDIFNSSLNMP